MWKSAHTQLMKASFKYGTTEAGVRVQVKKDLGPLGTFMLEIKPDASGQQLTSTHTGVIILRLHA